MAAAATIRIEPGHCISSAPIPALRFMETNETRLALIAGLIEVALDAGLRGAEWVDEKGLDWCSEAYNGIGPEFLPPALRAKVTQWLHLFEPAALIHDARNHVSDGFRAAFERANEEFLHNCLVLANRAYPWWRWKRYRARAAAWAMFEFVSSDSIGWRAWLEAHERFVARTAPEVAPSYPGNTTKPPEGTY